MKDIRSPGPAISTISQKGLIGISVQNNVIILYDNDAEGVSSFNRIRQAQCARQHAHGLKLPDLAEFRDFETVGPSGAHRAGINGRAVAIECYLDVGPAATVRWNNYHKELGAYHGELVDKGDVMWAFLAQSEVNGDYDFSRIATVVDMIVSECTAMAGVGAAYRPRDVISGGRAGRDPASPPA